MYNNLENFLYRKMEQIDLLNQVANVSEEIVYQLVKINQLNKNMIYKLTNIRKVNTIYGPSIIACAENNLEFFLPKRIVAVLYNNDGELFNTLITGIKQQRIGFKYIGGVNKCEFIQQ